MTIRCARASTENYALLEGFAQSWQAVASEDYPELAPLRAREGRSATLDLDPCA